MSSTQEKQEHKCHWRAYGQPDGTVVCDECNTAADVNKLIDSAKREGAIEELKKLPSNRHESSSYCNAEFFIDSEDGNFEI